MRRASGDHSTGRGSDVPAPESRDDGPARVVRFRMGEDELAVVSLPWVLPRQRVELTPAEAAIAAAIQDGLSNAEIARARGRSPRTVANQVASLLRKLGAGSRAELAAKLSSWSAERSNDE